MIRALLACLFLLPCILRAQTPIVDNGQMAKIPSAAVQPPASQPSASPATDWKAAYDNANESAKQWKARAEMLQEQLKKTQDSLQNMLDLEQSTYQHYKAAATRRSSTGTAGQVPPEIADEIRAEAEKHWPGNYHMQQYQVDQETKAYIQLHSGN